MKTSKFFTIATSMLRSGLLLGRSHCCDVKINNKYVSGLHCIIVENEVMNIMDLSKNGVFVFINETWQRVEKKLSTSLSQVLLRIPGIIIAIKKMDPLTSCSTIITDNDDNLLYDSTLKCVPNIGSPTIGLLQFYEKNRNFLVGNFLKIVSNGTAEDVDVHVSTSFVKDDNAIFCLKRDAQQYFWLYSNSNVTLDSIPLQGGCFIKLLKNKTYEIAAIKNNLHFKFRNG